jgi:macrolide-specific efflux system membrane fusion protein
MQTALIVLGTVLLLTGPQRGPVSEGEARTYLVKGCTITLIDEVNVPAEEAGKLVDMQTPLLDYSGNPVLEQGQPVLVEVREGTQVSQGQLLARIDDRVEQKLKKVAEYKLQVAEAEAGNDVSVRYAEAASKVAKQEYDMKRGANLVHPGSVAQSEVQRAALALRQAELQIEQSTHELNIAKVSVSLREAELEVAEMQLERRQIEAPIDGIIVDRHVKPGEWVKPGDPVLRIVRINRVRIKASVPKSQVMPAEIANQPVAVRFSPESAVRLPRGVKERAFQGRVGFVSPVVDPDGSYTVWADVENVWFATAPGQPGQGFWVLRPGDTVEMTIDLRPVEGAVQTAHAGAP